MSYTRHTNTFMLYTKRGKKIGKIYGPIFHSEVETIKDAVFSRYKKVYIAEENAFRAAHIDEYSKHVQLNWIDKLYCYLELNESWVGDVKLIPPREGYYNDWFILASDEETKEQPVLRFSSSVEADQFHVAKLLRDLSILLPIKIIEDGIYYKSKFKPELLYTNAKALSGYLAEALVTHMCLN